MYCDKLAGVGRDEKIRIKVFRRSPKREALTWHIDQDARKWSKWVDMASDFNDRFEFNTENAPDWFYIQNPNKMPGDTFRDYAIKWSSEDTRAKPTMDKSQMNCYFIQAQEPQYYNRMMLVAETSFIDIIKLGGWIEKGIKNGSIINLEALQATNKALQSGCLFENLKKKEVSAVMLAHRTKSPSDYQSQLHLSLTILHLPTLHISHLIKHISLTKLLPHNIYNPHILFIIPN